MLRNKQIYKKLFLFNYYFFYLNFLSDMDLQKRMSGYDCTYLYGMDSMVGW